MTVSEYASMSSSDAAVSFSFSFQNCGGCSSGGCDDGGNEVQVLVIRTQVIRIIMIDGGESLAVP